MTREELLYFFDYDRTNGELYWKNHWDKSVVTKLKGKKVGTIRKPTKHTPSSYLNVMIREKTYLVHRLIWVIETGTEPDQVDHIDGNGLNNRITNLRSVDNQGNQRNRKTHRNGRLPNCFFCKSTNSWRARFRFNKKTVELGRFPTELQAYTTAYLALKERRGI